VPTRHHVWRDGVRLWHGVVTAMVLGIHKRDRMARRADKVWRSVWHRQMLQLNRTSKALDNRVEVLSYDGSSSDGSSDTSSSTLTRTDGGSHG
jgi:hypothetical protein